MKVSADLSALRGIEWRQYALRFVLGGLAARARELYPTLKILFTTGYARNAIFHQGRLDKGV